MSKNSQIAFTSLGDTIVLSAGEIPAVGIRAPVYAQFDPQNVGQYKITNSGLSTAFLGIGPSPEDASNNAVAPLVGIPSSAIVLLPGEVKTMRFALEAYFSSSASTEVLIYITPGYGVSRVFSTSQSVFPTAPPPTPPPFEPLKTAVNFSVFGITVTVAANSSANLFVGGDSPEIVGQVIGSEQHFSDSVSTQASLDITSAIAYYKAFTPTATLVGDLIGQTLTPAVYSAGAALANTGVLKFDAQGNTDAKFIILCDASIGSGAGSFYLCVNGAQAKNITWVVDGAVTFAANTFFSGTILGRAAIGLGAGCSIYGRLLSNIGAVTIAGSNINTY